MGTVLSMSPKESICETDGFKAFKYELLTNARTYRPSAHERAQSAFDSHDLGRCDVKSEKSRRRIVVGRSSASSSNLISSSSSSPGWTKVQGPAAAAASGSRRRTGFPGRLSGRLASWMRLESSHESVDVENNNASATGCRRTEDNGGRGGGGGGQKAHSSAKVDSAFQKSISCYNLKVSGVPPPKTPFPSGAGTAAIAPLNANYATHQMNRHTLRSKNATTALQNIVNNNHHYYHHLLNPQNGAGSRKTSAVTRNISPRPWQKQNITNNAATTTKTAATTTSAMDAKRATVQASATELLTCLGEFLRQSCDHLTQLNASDASTWLRSVDRSLLLQGWQDVVFINPATVVFVFLLISEEVKHTSKDELPSERSLQALVLTCLYLSYSYLGSEISYPLKPFLVDHDRRMIFWSRCLRMIESLSQRMLRINNDPKYFAMISEELKSYTPPPNNSTPPLLPPP